MEHYQICLDVIMHYVKDISKHLFSSQFPLYIVPENTFIRFAAISLRRLVSFKMPCYNDVLGGESH